MDNEYTNQYDAPQQKIIVVEQVDPIPIIVQINSPDNYWFESGTAVVVALISAFVALRLRRKH